MAIGAQIGRTPLGGGSDLPFYNYGVTDIPANVAVTLDTTNVIGGSNLGYGIVLPAADGVPVLGTTCEIIRAGTAGRVQVAGVALGIASGAITAKQTLMVDGTTSGKIGWLKTQTSAKAQVGIALATVADGETIPYLQQFALNA